MKESFTECNFTFYKKEFHNIAQNIMTKTKIDVLRNYTCKPNGERSGQTETIYSCQSFWSGDPDPA